MDVKIILELIDKLYYSDDMQMNEFYDRLGEILDFGITDTLERDGYDHIKLPDGEVVKLNYYHNVKSMKYYKKISNVIFKYYKEDRMDIYIELEKLILENI